MSNSSGFLRDASRRQERARDSQGRLAERREKGLWSFLTWSFFLSQVVTMEQASAAEAQAGGTGDEAGPTSDPAAGQAARNAFLPVEAAMLAELQEAGPQATTQSLAQQATAPIALLAGAPGEAAVATVPDSTDEFAGTRQTSAAPDTEAASKSLIAAAPDLGAAAPPSMGGPSGEDHLPSTGPADVDPLIGPIVGIVGDVVQVLDPVVQQVVAPVLGMVGDVVGDVMQMLDPVLEQVVAPVLGMVGDVVGDVVQMLDPVVQQVVAPVLGMVGEVAGDVVQVLDPVLEQVIAPVFDGAGEVLGDAVHALNPVLDQVIAPVADVLGGPLGSLLGLGSDGGAPIVMAAVVASSGSIDFEAGPAAGSLPLDDLFSGGGYSDYNLTLQAGVSASANPAPGGILPGLDIAGELNVWTGNAPTEGGPDAQGNTHHIGLPSLLGDAGLHWLGL